jgi:hypothetical protein
MGCAEALARVGVPMRLTKGESSDFQAFPPMAGGLQEAVRPVAKAFLIINI